MMKDDDLETWVKDNTTKKENDEIEGEKDLSLAASDSALPVTPSKDKKKKKAKKNKKKKKSTTEQNDDQDSVKDVGGDDEDKVAKTTGDQDGSESDDDEELLAAAAAWAENDEGDDSPTNEPAATTAAPTSAAPAAGATTNADDLSLHITQLPYDTIELDLRRLFAEKGCRLSSIRLVYDRDEKGRKTVFRGVAFIDLLDAESYEKALAMNRKSTIRGRKLNIRPTRSKQELASIVTRTRELVQEKIRKQIEEGNSKGVSDTKNESPKLSNKQKEKQKKKQKKEKAKAKAAKAKSKLEAKHKPPGGGEVKEGEAKKAKGEKKEAYKLSKKERNRRAAIIMGRKGGKK